MDFLTATQSPVPVTIRGKSYLLPRFLNSGFKEMAADMLEAQRKRAVSEIEDEKTRATFLLYHNPVPIDTARVFQEITTPDGAERVVRRQAALAGVPEADIEDMVALSDPMMLRSLADDLATATQGAARAGADPEEQKAGPLVSQPGTSAGSPETGPETSPDSPAPSPQ